MLSTELFEIPRVLGRFAAPGCGSVVRGNHIDPELVLGAFHVHHRASGEPGVEQQGTGGLLQGGHVLGAMEEIDIGLGELVGGGENILKELVATARRRGRKEKVCHFFPQLWNDQRLGGLVVPTLGEAESHGRHLIVLELGGRDLACNRGGIESSHGEVGCASCRGSSNLVGRIHNAGWDGLVGCRNNLEEDLLEGVDGRGGILVFIVQRGRANHELGGKRGGTALKLGKPVSQRLGIGGGGSQDSLLNLFVPFPGPAGPEATVGVGRLEEVHVRIVDGTPVAFEYAKEDGEATGKDHQAILLVRCWDERLERREIIEIRLCERGAHIGSPKVGYRIMGFFNEADHVSGELKGCGLRLDGHGIIVALDDKHLGDVAVWTSNVARRANVDWLDVAGTGIDVSPSELGLPESLLARLEGRAYVDEVSSGVEGLGTLVRGDLLGSSDEVTALSAGVTRADAGIGRAAGDACGNRAGKG